jgi:ribonuclease P protein component
LSVSRFRFRKTQRVFLKHDVAQLFGKGHAFLIFPFKVILTENENSEYPLKILISVPKNKHRKAVVRNKIKRWTREAYRLNCNQLVEQLSSAGKAYLAGFIYINDKLPEHEIIEKSMQKILKKIEVLAFGSD